MLLNSKNIIFHGAPGTGKTYLARKIAIDIATNGEADDIDQLNEEQKEQIAQQIEFVQFHPNYDYADFVEGLRPKINDGAIGFELRDGVFKKFIKRARKNYENSNKTEEFLEKEFSVQKAMETFFSNIENQRNFKTINQTNFTITNIDDAHINILIPENEIVKTLSIKISDIQKLLESEKTFKRVKDIYTFLGKSYARQEDSYNFIIYNEIKKLINPVSKKTIKKEPLKNYIFIIDEINRGEISKIFGELFFSIDPGYRGEKGKISTQYANMHDDPDEKFFIPQNVYIIGTMNDIDRSVDSFDFAMRRRFRFIELKANERLEMLDSLEDENIRNEAKRRMHALNEAIANVEDLNEHYQIGAAYFLKLKSLTFEQLWTDCLEPLLKDYIQGAYHESDIMKNLKDAYFLKESKNDVAPN